MIYRRGCTILITLFIGLLCTGCFSKGKEFMPDQVIENALRDDSFISYYAETEVIIYENDVQQSIATNKEWFREDGMTRLETNAEDGTTSILINNLDVFYLYDVLSNEVFQADATEFDEIMKTPKDDMLELIGTIQETHDITYVGEEKIIDRKAHRIQATPRDKTSIIGEQEFWIDAEHWISLKHRTIVGDHMSEVIYTHFEVKKELEDELFDIEITDDMTVIHFDDLYDEKLITLDEMLEQLGKPFMYFAEKNAMNIQSINVFQYDENSAEQFTISYTKHGLPFLSLTIVDGIYPSFFEETEEITVNDHTVYYSSEYGDIYEWNLKGIRYEIWMDDPSVPQEEILEILGEMVEFTENSTEKAVGEDQS